MRSLTRRRAQLPTPVSNTSTLVVDSNPPTAISSLLEGAQDAPTEAGLQSRGLRGGAHDAWETNGSWWVAFIIGVLNAPAPDATVFVIAIIVPSGAAIGTQVSAAIVFVIEVLAVVEITLICYLAWPAKTQEVHDGGVVFDSVGRLPRRELLPPSRRVRQLLTHTSNGWRVE